ncbi:unnamed protein product, partial [Amoebophrya sp. A25]
RLKTGKAAGRDQLKKERYELLSAHRKSLVREKVRKYWREGALDEGEVDSLIVVLPKPGKDHSSTAGWRPIALLNFFARIFASALCLRLVGPIDQALSEAQAGYRPYRRAIDNTLALKLAIQARAAVGRAASVCFVDLTQAFDTVPRKLVARAFEAY